MPDVDDLTAWIDGELPPDEAAAIARAVADDPVLERQAARLRRARAFVRGQGPVAAPDGFADAVLDRLDEEPVARPFQVLGIPWQGLALAAVALVVLWAALPQAPPTEPPRAAVQGTETTAVSAQGGAAVALVAPTWSLGGELSDAQLRQIVESMGGELRTDARVVVRIPVRRAFDLRAELASRVPLVDVGERRQAAGQVEIEITRVP